MQYFSPKQVENENAHTFGISSRLYLLATVLITVTALHAGQGTWTTTFPFGGRILPHGVFLDPVNPAVIYAAPVWRGIYRSTDATNSWENITDDIELPFDRTGIRILTTGPAPGSLYAVSHNGLFRSTDEGTTWTQIDNGITGNILVLAFDPGNADVVYAGTLEGGLFKTVNAGANWWSIGSPDLPADHIRSIAIDPVQPQILYLGTLSHGCYKSFDGGQTWIPINNNVNMTKIESIVIDPANTLTLYAADSDPSTGMGIFKSADGGQSWTKLSPTLEFGWGPGPYIAIDPVDTENIYSVTHAAVFLSNDGGSNWDSSPVSSSQVNSITVDPANPQVLYAGTREGIFKSTNRGQSWIEASNGIRAISFAHSSAHSLAIDRSDPSFMYAGTTDGTNGRGYRSADGGQTWTKMLEWGISSIATNPSSPGDVFVFRNDIAKSSDRGLTFTQLNNGFFCCFTEGDMVLHPSDPLTIYLAGANSEHSADGIYKTTDGGLNWTLMNAGLENPKIHALGIDPNDGDVVYAGTRANSGNESAIYKTTDGGQNWIKLTGGLIR